MRGEKDMDETTNKLTPQSLWTLEHYAKVRKKFREEMIKHKKNRMVRLGENLTLHFEDFDTIKYQVQEILRIEKTFEEEGILAGSSSGTLIAGAIKWCKMQKNTKAGRDIRL